MENITSLDLSFNQIGEACVAATSGTKELTKLNLSHHQIGNAGAKHLSQMQRIPRYHTTETPDGITDLNLNSNRIKDTGTDSMDYDVLRYFSFMQPITELNLSNHQIEVDGACQPSNLRDLTT